MQQSPEGGFAPSYRSAWGLSHSICSNMANFSQNLRQPQRSEKRLFTSINDMFRRYSSVAHRAVECIHDVGLQLGDDRRLKPGVAFQPAMISRTGMRERNKPRGIVLPAVYRFGQIPLHFRSQMKSLRGGADRQNQFYLR